MCFYTVQLNPFPGNVSRQENPGIFLKDYANMCDSPSMQEKRKPEPIKLIWNLWVEERQQSTDIIHAMHLKKG